MIFLLSRIISVVIYRCFWSDIPITQTRHTTRVLEEKNLLVVSTPCLKQLFCVMTIIELETESIAFECLEATNWARQSALTTTTISGNALFPPKGPPLLFSYRYSTRTSTYSSTRSTLDATTQLIWQTFTSQLPRRNLLCRYPLLTLDGSIVDWRCQCWIVPFFSRSTPF
jgi:hypothetical protein